MLRPQFESPTPSGSELEGQRRGWAYADYANLRSTTYQVDLPDSEEGWQKHLGSKARKVMRWEMRKFAERGGEVVAAAVIGRPKHSTRRAAAARALGRRGGLFRA